MDLRPMRSTVEFVVDGGEGLQVMVMVMDVSKL